MAEKTNGQDGMAPKKGKTGMSKMEAVRQALAQLGKTAKPLQLQTAIKEKFGIEMTPDHISNYKSEILKKKGGKKKTAKKATAPKMEAKSTAAKVNGKSYGGLSLQDVEAVKSLLGRLGSSSLKGLIDVLAR